MTGKNGASVVREENKAGLSDEDGAVRSILEGVYAAWARNDTDGFVAEYAEDATAVLPGTYLANRDAIQAAMTAAFEGSLKGSRAMHEVQSVRFPGRDTAIVISQGAVLLAGQTEPTAESKALETWVLARRDRRWLVEAFHNCALNAA